jgi:hypothetical protein
MSRAPAARRTSFLREPAEVIEGLITHEVEIMKEKFHTLDKQS